MPPRPGCQRLADTADPRVWTAHEYIDVDRLVAGRQILLGGHTFTVGSMRFITGGRVTGDPRPGYDFLADVGQVELALMHAVWKGCPAVEPPGGGMPAAWRQDLADLRDAALRILVRPETTAADAAFLRVQLAPLVDLDAAGAPRG